MSFNKQDGLGQTDDRDETTSSDGDVFGHEAAHDIKYKTLSWQMVAALMIAEIASNGTLSLPSSLAVVGMVPGLIMIVFLGAFAMYTSYLLIQFKLRHPEVHNMGDAGYVLFGPVGREMLAFGTVSFAVFLAGSQLIAGSIALEVLSDDKLCSMLYIGIFAIPVGLMALPRTYDGLSWLSMLACGSIFISCLVALIGAGLHPVPDRIIDATVSSDFYAAFISITNPVFAFAGHFLFFALISEMKEPRQAMRAAYTLQTSTTIFYAVFAAVTYAYLGSQVQSPSFSSLSPKWSKAAYGLVIPNLLIAGSIYIHTAAKIVFIRMFRNTRHVFDHTLLGWLVWVALVLIATAAAFVLAVGVPIFNNLVGVASAAFAAWFTYGIAGMFWIHDTYHDGPGTRAWWQQPVHLMLSVFTILAGGFICVAGLYASINSIVIGYRTGAFPKAFVC